MPVSKTLTAFNYFGGKFHMIREIYKYIPVHHHFVDAFCGSMVVTLNKPMSMVETANDINGDVVNFFKVLRDKAEDLAALLYLTPVARQEYDDCWDMTGCSDVERARRFYVRVRQSVIGLGIQHKYKGWHLTVMETRRHCAERVSKWITGAEGMLEVIDRLKFIQIENKDFRQIIPLLDDKGTFFYCDPPYLPESRVSFNDYKYDFKKTDHIELSEILHQIKGKAMISAYQCKTMDQLYHDWKMVVLGGYHTMTGKKGRECIYMNYDITHGQQKLSL